MTLRRSVGSVVWERHFDTEHIKFIRYHPTASRSNDRGRSIPPHRAWPDQGVIECGLGKKSIRFGCDLDPAEAARVIDALSRSKRREPQ